MAEEYFTQADQFPPLTVLLSAPNTLAGQTWRGTLPLAALELDGRSGQRAVISAVLAAKFGGANLPAGATCRLLANAHGANWSDEFNARKTPLGSIGVELTFGKDFAGMANVPLVFTVAGKTTDSTKLENVVLPTIATNTSAITLNDIHGGAAASYFVKTGNIQTENLQSLTLLLSLAQGVNIAGLRGKTLRVTAAMNNQEYDHEPGSPAWFYSISEMHMGNASSQAPNGINLREVGKHIRFGSDDEQQSVVWCLEFDLEFAPNCASFTNVPLVVKGFPADIANSENFSLPEFIAPVDMSLQITDTNGDAVAFRMATAPGIARTTISGNATVTGLAQNSAPTRITIDHAGAANFALCEDPRTNAPVGVIARVVASRENGDDTNGAQFVLEVENKTYGNGYNYGGAIPNITINWTRTGLI